MCVCVCVCVRACLAKMTHVLLLLSRLSPRNLECVFVRVEEKESVCGEVLVCICVAKIFRALVL